VRRVALAMVATPLVAMTLSLLGGSLLGGTGIASAGADTTDTTNSSETTSGASVDATLAPVDVLQVSGLVDHVVVQSIEQAIARAEQGGSQALILQMNSGGSVVSRADMTELVQTIADAPIAIGIWIGPARSAEVFGTPAQLMGVADVTAMVAGSRFGHTGPLVELAEGSTVITFGAAADQLRNGSLSFAEARTLGALKLDTPDVGVPTIRSMVLAMDGVEAVVGRASEGRTVVLDTVAEGIGEEGNAELTSTLVRFAKLGLLDQLMHTVASPPVAYLFLLTGLALLVFEFFTAGVGVAGVVGAICTFLASFGLVELPTRWWAAALIGVAMLAFAIDVQVGIPRFWTGVGIVFTIIGSWFLFDDLPGTSLRVGWIPLLVGIAGIMLTFIVGMPSMVRTRFATPTIGREWMIGETGVAAGDLAPDGVVIVGGARWRARTNRATPVTANDTVRVVAIDGVTLEVEPETGGARDYREGRQPATP
jgi:membrane-bound serine protease (ClpP class)